LGSFDFRPHYLIDFVKECVVKYLEDDMVYVALSLSSFSLL